MKDSNQFLLLKDACEGRMKALLERVFEGAKVEVVQPTWHMFVVTATIEHRGRTRGICRQFSTQCIDDPYFYAGYMRDRLPAEAARMFVEDIMFGR